MNNYRLMISSFILLITVLVSTVNPMVSEKNTESSYFKKAVGLALLLSPDENNTDTINKMERVADEFYLKYPEYKSQPVLYLFVAQAIEKYDPNRSERLYRLVKQWGDQDWVEVAESSLRQLNLTGKPLPIKFNALDGRRVDLTDMKGKVVLVDFWATWCMPSVMEISEILKVYQKYHDKGFEVVGISLDRNQQYLEKVIKSKGISWPQYYDGRGWKSYIGSKYGITEIPTLWLIDKKGNLVDMEAREDLFEKVDKLINDIPLGASPNTTSTPANQFQPMTKINWAN